MEKSFPLHGRRLMSQLWGQGQASTCKSVITVDAETPLSDDEAMLGHILDNFDINTGVYITEGIVDALDHSSYQWAYGGKIGIDCTSPMLGEPLFGEDAKKRTAPRSTDAELLTKLSALDKRAVACRGYAKDRKNSVLLIALDKEGATQSVAESLSTQIFESDIASEYDVFVFVDAKNNDLFDGHKLMWRIFNNTDWNKDTRFSAARDRMSIDSTAKGKADGFDRRWPDDLEIPTAIKKIVDEKRPKTGLN